MKLIIDIPEEVKHKVYAYGLSLSPSDKEQLIKAIMNGIPLEQIRNEIEQAKTIEIKMDDTAFKVSADVVINPQYRNFTSGLDIALHIIDKYKGEKE